MIFENINSLSIVDDFVAKYGDKIINKYSHLKDLGIKICIDTQAPALLKALDDCKDSPYMSNPSCNLIIKHKDTFNKCGFLVNEEMAIIAHELGHIIAFISKEVPKEQLQKEYQADDFSIFLGLADELKSALKKMVEADICPDSNKDMQKRIDRICEIQGDGYK